MAESAKWEPNQEFLVALTDLGISRDKAIKALKYVNNRSVDEAATLVFESDLHSSSSDAEDEEEIDPDKCLKMVFVVNCSLNMNSGKIAAQVAHAAIDLYQSASDQDSFFNVLWQQTGQTKIVLRGETEQDLINLEQVAKQTSTRLFTTLIHDAGRTEVAPDSLTCLGLYGSLSDIDKITGKLRLLKTCAKCQ
jgi:PTH2 family peptidyl-tRNA hydrolase